MADKVIFRDLEVRTVLGNDSWERKKAQPVVITAEIHTSISSAGKSDKVTESVHYGIACKRATSFAESEHGLQSLEAFAEGIARVCLEVTSRALSVYVFARKPRALLHAKYAGVEIYRTRKEVFGNWSEDDNENETAQYAASVVSERAAAINAAGALSDEDHIVVKKLSMSTIIGVNLWERHYKQVVDLDLVLHMKKPTAGDGVHDKVPRYRNFRTVVDAVTDMVEKTSYRTVEALATAVARTAIKQCKVPKITVRVEKPSALVFAACSAVEITRSSEDFSATTALNSAAISQAPSAAISACHTPSQAETPAEFAADAESKLDPGMHSVYIALGTNVGDRLGNLHKALNRLNTDLPMSRLVDTSFLYETAPMYVTDQPAFLNAACLVRTKLEPIPLLNELKRIESEMGRNFAMYRNGPRVIDLDILFYDELLMETEKLTIPHALLHERRFQLGPLCDIDCDLMHHKLGKTSGALYRHLTTHSAAPDDIVRVTPLKTQSHTPLVQSDANSDKEEPSVLKSLSPGTQKETVFMGILNCTPDSFSDGGDFSTVDKAVEHAQELIRNGADIIDIGGQSTRPGATQVGVETEIERIVPVIKRIRELDIKVPISVDTFYANVAAAALDAGADIINDVTGGYFDSQMLALVAQRQCPYILMHMRGDPATMTTMNDYSEYDGDVMRGTRFELAQRVRAALDAGVPRWNIIIDPGIGFAKEGVQNFEILRRLPELTARHIRAASSMAKQPKIASTRDEAEEGFVDEDLAADLVNYPVLVGSSRKRFIGNVTGKTNAKDRVWGTAATVTAAIQGGAGIVRVHDVAEMVDVARVSDHIYR
ncbi:trifunctional dihydropteroate synthetase [Coemansia brasiliensis]|uniref:Trifunctional dihydropteroate synthetase n=1 Tax=Coemansia brasiliensis TaxID=2650707 RepID=A0A9W8I4S8_9FUNG|nr:trifunctional dihydropteroate synthetase [Coemansia brasiliensis]